MSKVETLTLFSRFASIAVFTVNTTLTTRKIPWEMLQVFEVSEELLCEGCGGSRGGGEKGARKTSPHLCTTGKGVPPGRRVYPTGVHTVLPTSPPVLAQLPPLPPAAPSLTAQPPETPPSLQMTSKSRSGPPQAPWEMKGPTPKRKLKEFPGWKGPGFQECGIPRFPGL